MVRSKPGTNGRRRRFLLGGVLGALVLAIASVAVVQAVRSVTLGETNRTPKPKCVPPSDNDADGQCFAIGKITGFMTKLNGERRPFHAPRDGHIVAWSVKLSRKPSDRKPQGGGQSQLDFFQSQLGSERYGNGPTARISILKRLTSGPNKGEYRLKRQSPVVKMDTFFNERPVITLDKPLRIRKGEIAALTTVTWLTNFLASGDAGNSQWRTSRNKGKCGSGQTLKTRPHTKVKSTRQYACEYRERIIYWATFVPERRTGGGN